MHPTIELMGDRTRAIVIWITTVVLPAAITLYLTVAPVMSWDGTEKVVTIMAAVNTFLGVVLGINSRQRRKNTVIGTMSVRKQPGDEPDHLHFDWDEDPVTSMASKKRVKFNIKNTVYNEPSPIPNP